MVQTKQHFFGRWEPDFNPFVPIAPFHYTLKTSEGRERVHWEQMGQATQIDD